MEKDCYKNFVRTSLEYMRNELSVPVLIPRNWYNREYLPLYDILAYMVRFTKDIYVVKLTNGKFRVSYDGFESFESDTLSDACCKMVNSFIEDGRAYVVTPPIVNNHLENPFNVECWGEPNELDVLYAEL